MRATCAKTHILCNSVKQNTRASKCSAHAGLSPSSTSKPPAHEAGSGAMSMRHNIHLISNAVAGPPGSA